jgi:hypothetical protein
MNQRNLLAAGQPRRQRNQAPVRVHRGGAPGFFEFLGSAHPAHQNRYRDVHPLRTPDLRIRRPSSRRVNQLILDVSHLRSLCPSASSPTPRIPAQILTYFEAIDLRLVNFMCSPLCVRHYRNRALVGVNPAYSRTLHPRLDHPLSPRYAISSFVLVPWRVSRPRIE